MHKQLAKANIGFILFILYVFISAALWSARFAAKANKLEVHISL